MIFLKEIFEINIENIKLGGSFKIRWLRYSDLSFNKIAHLRNRYNNNEPIKKSRDTQVMIIEKPYIIFIYYKFFRKFLWKSDEKSVVILKI